MSREAWSVDRADPSVGIFADTVIHEACRYGDEVEPADGPTYTVIGNADPELVDVFVQYRCQCGQAVSWIAYVEPARDYEPSGPDATMGR